MELALIGGTGVYDPDVLTDRRVEKADTPYGLIEVDVGRLNGVEIAFLPRHGLAHHIPPHKINHRANLWGLKMLGVTRVISTSAVGSLNREMLPGDFVVIDQFIDFTKAGVTTFYDGGEGGVVHTDVTEPYCPELRKAALSVGGGLEVNIHRTGTYLTVDGPRYETAAEIKMYRTWGADVIGMTNAPEAILAREANLCYATVATVTNMAAGISESPLRHDEVAELMRTNIANVRAICLETLVTVGGERNCGCGG